MIVEIGMQIPEGSLECDTADVLDEIRETLNWMVSKGMIDDYELEVKAI